MRDDEATHAAVSALLPGFRAAAQHGKRTYREILVLEIVQGLGELRRPASGLLLSGASAGLDIGFSVFLMGAMIALLRDLVPDAVLQLIGANLYAVGFIFVVLGRSELFTEHTTLAVFPVLSGRASPQALARLWSLVYVGNLCGALLSALVISFVGGGLGTVPATALQTIAQPLLAHPAWVMLASATLAGWLMGLLSWLVAAGRETLSQVFFVWLVAGTIGLLQLHHSILGTVEVAAAIFAGAGVSFADLGRFLFWSTLGNSAGGVFFVALIKYGHVVRGSPSEPDADEEDAALPPGSRSPAQGPPNPA